MAGKVINMTAAVTMTTTTIKMRRNTWIWFRTRRAARLSLTSTRYWGYTASPKTSASKMNSQPMERIRPRPTACSSAHNTPERNGSVGKAKTSARRGKIHLVGRSPCRMSDSSMMLPFRRDDMRLASTNTTRWATSATKTAPTRIAMDNNNACQFCPSAFTFVSSLHAPLSPNTASGARCFSLDAGPREPKP